MAKIFPSDWRSVEATGAAQREIETLALLELALPDAYTVYHGVRWTRVGSGDGGFWQETLMACRPRKMDRLTRTWLNP